MKRLLSLLSLALVSCGETHTGGFETTDLQARVVRPDGSPVSAARAWLVRSAGESSPATVVDSGFTDASGMIRFAAPANGLSGLGVDAAARDSIGLSPRSLETNPTALVVVGATHRVRIPADSTGAARCFVPGSHFASTLAFDGATAQLDLPSGTWSLAIQRGPSVYVQNIVLVTDTILGNPSLPPADTTNKAGASLLAGRIQLAGLDGLQVDIVNPSATSLDSLSLRLYLDGTASELADFGARLDMALLYTSGGFSKPAGFSGFAWTPLSPQAVGGSCPAATICSWTFDLPIDTASIEPGGRLELSLLFESRASRGSRPTHDPFTGNDWSFRTRTWADSASNPSGLPDYAGVPAVSGTDLPPSAPYMILLRNDRLIAGKPPSAKP
ncbi:MAG: hypothetical protein IPK50_07430 [Fibrobacterota bacterium]|nr:hypothetical protein [Fibrobacterota bacterium]QQS06724.1 MAG: hypothetical protein IPK50_07430 [Fibrobacterota bacterium]